jgi:hypothetical protein
MARHPYRSQPTLQRSGGRIRFPIVGLSLLGAAAVGIGALITPVLTAPSPPPDPVGAALQQAMSAPPPAPPAPPAQEPQAEVASADTVSSASTSPAPQPGLAPKGERPPRIVKAKTPVATSIRRRPPASDFSRLSLETPQQRWEEQRSEYEQARRAYDASERVAGFRWAQENRIAAPRHCRVAAQRTSAFMEGCMSYAR